METFKEILSRAGHIPDLQLFIKKEGGGVVSTGPHRVKLLEAKAGKMKDFQGNEKYVVWLYVEENGVKFKYPVDIKNKEGGIHYLVERFAEIPEGATVILEGKRSQSGKTNYVEVRRVEEEMPLIDEREPESEEEDLPKQFPDELSDEEIPVIEDEQYGDFPPDFE